MNILAFFGRLLSRLRSREDLHFVLYTRKGCHLCDTAHEQLIRAQERYHFVLETSDVDADPDLAARFGDCVPVVTVNGKVRFRGAVNPVLLKRLLESRPRAGSNQSTEAAKQISPGQRPGS